MDFVKQKLLFGWMTRAQVVDYVLQCSKDDADRLDGILTKWTQAYQTRLLLTKNEANLADDVEVSQIDSRFEKKLEGFTSQQTFKNTFKDCRTQFKLVEIDKMIAPVNKTITLNAVDSLLAKYPHKPTLDELIEICLSPARESTRLDRIRNDKYNYVYSAEDQDLRLIDVIARPINEFNLADVAEGLPVRALVVLVGFGYPMVTAISLNKRIVLMNGYHRLYALRSLGVKRVPALVTSEVSGFDGSSLEYAASRPRPPLFKDFFDPGLTLEVSQQHKKRVMKLSFSQELFDVIA